MTLLREIQRDTTDSTVSISTLLRKCKILSSRLKSEEFDKWIMLELEGYKENDLLPDYRILRVESKGHFSGPFGSGLRNAPIPLSCFDKKYREGLSHSYINQPIAAIEYLITDSKTSLQEPWDADFVAYFGRNIYTNQSCVSAWKVIPAQAMIAIIDTVKTRVLNFAIKIEAENPNAGEAELDAKPISGDKVSQIFNTYITGDIQNYSTGNRDVNQQATLVNKTDSQVFDDILDALNSSNLILKEMNDLKISVTEMKANYQDVNFPSKYQKFMSIVSDHITVLAPVIGPYLGPLAKMATG